MKLGGRGAIRACVLIGGLVAACGGGAAVTSGDWALTSATKDAAAPVVEAADEPMMQMEAWAVPTGTAGGSSSSGGSSSGGAKDAGSSGSSSSGATVAPCTTCMVDTDCSQGPTGCGGAASCSCGPPNQTGYNWCCVKGMCASLSYMCGGSSSSGGHSSSSGGNSSSGGGPCGGNGQQCCTGMMCPNSPAQMCFNNMCF